MKKFASYVGGFCVLATHRQGGTCAERSIGVDKYKSANWLRKNVVVHMSQQMPPIELVRRGSSRMVGVRYQDIKATTML